MPHREVRLKGSHRDPVSLPVGSPPEQKPRILLSPDSCRLGHEGCIQSNSWAPLVLKTVLVVFLATGFLRKAEEYRHRRIVTSWNPGPTFSSQWQYNSSTYLADIPERPLYGRYYGSCYALCNKARRVLLAPDYDPETIERLRSATCIHFIPQKGFCDSLITEGEMESPVFTKGYMREARNFFGNVSERLAPRVGGTIVFMPSDTTDDVLSSEIDVLWDNKMPFVPHSIRKRTTKRYILMPDYHFIMGQGFDTLRQEFREGDIPFRERQPFVFWRGSSTGDGLNCSLIEVGDGPGFEDSECGRSTRVHLALQSRSVPYLDVGIVRATDCCLGQEDQLEANGVLGQRVQEYKWRRYRGVLEVDGLVNAWGFFWRLYSGSVVFKVESSYVSSYSGLLRPWIHYVPIHANLSNLAEVSAMVLSNKTEDINFLSTIASNARKAIANVTFSSEVKRVSEELTMLWSD